MYNNPTSNRIANTLIAINNLLLKEKEINTLLKQVNLVFTETAGYYFSWIGLFNGKNELCQIEHSGQASGFKLFRENAAKGILPETYKKALSCTQAEVIQQLNDADPFFIENKKCTYFITAFTCNSQSRGLMCAAVPEHFSSQESETKLFAQLAQNIEYAVCNKLEKQALLELAISEEEAYLLFDNQLNSIAANETFCTTFNCDINHCIGKPITTILGSQFLGSEYKNLIQALSTFQKGGQLEAFELKYRNKVFQLSTKIQKAPNISLGIIRDITTEKAETKKRQKAETKYLSLFNATNKAILILPLSDTTNYTFTEVNEQACLQYGYSRQEFMELTIRDLIVRSEKNIEISANNRIKLINEGYSICEMEHKTKNGAIIPVEISSYLYQDEDRKMIVSLVRDISTIKNLKDKNDLFLKAIESTPLSIVVTDKTGNIEYVNPFFEEETAYTREEVYGKKPRILKSGLQSAEFYKELWATILSGNNWHGEFSNKKKNGELYWENASISPIKNDKGQIEHFIAIKEDITQKKKTLEELELAKNKAEESDKLKSAFLNNMSHEIRTPMNSILGFSEQLKDSHLSSEEKDEYIEIIQTNGKRIQNTINDILDISKIEAGIETIKFEKTDLNGFLTDLYLYFNSEAKDKNLAFEFINKASGQDTIMNTDSNKLKSILSNLLTNALKFTTSGKVSFGYTQKEDGFEFFVKDTGIGIAKSRQQAIFDSFVQADHSGTRLFEGLGLGLSITKSYTKILCGNLRFESEENKGTTFYVTIPSKQVELESSANKEVTKQASDNLKILIVEDDQNAAILLSAFLKSTTRDLLYTDNGAEAVTIVKNNPEIDLILMDVKLIEMDGFEASEKIREFNTDVKIIAQTAFVQAEDNFKAFEVGCDDFLTKPIRKADLLQSIQQLFDPPNAALD